jgi:hypothetical protein
LSIIDKLVFNVMSDAAILHILGKEMGSDFLDKFKIQDYHDAQIEYEVLAGSSLAAKRTMAQSMVMLTQILDNPQIQESLADINQEYIDFKPIISMWMEASEWKNKNDIIKKMTPEMIAETSSEFESGVDATASSGEAGGRAAEIPAETTAGRSGVRQPNKTRHLSPSGP